jgi:tRNA-2-methylthio-N6-dimethylallyladenosine synthase
VAQCHTPVPVSGRFYIHTFGCQMNEHDSARMAESLAREGWAPVPSAEAADLVLLNTCAIREKAEDKLFSALGRYRLLKAQRGLKIGVSGCVAQQEKEKLVQRAPFVDFVLGPDQLGKVAELAALPSAGKGLGRVETGWVPSEEYLFPRAEAETSRGSATAFVTAMKGCDNVCSFCVVPYTRGREVSRPYAEVVAEVSRLCSVGVREVTLIGQNVNSYAGGCTFAQLVRRVAEVPGLARIRFTTSHPMDLSDELIACFAPPAQGGVVQLMPHFHLPVQHGSDPVLQRMRRSYTVAAYERRVERLLQLCPQLSLTSDIICGFPGETAADHAQTLALLGRIPYDNLFSFIYSRRPHTTADKMLERNEAAEAQSPEWEEVSRQVALARLDEVQALQMARTLARHEAALGGEVEVLIESARLEPSGPQLFGRSRENWTVHFRGDARVGDLVRVRVEKATLASLTGVLTAVVSPATTPPEPAAHRRTLAVLQA